MNDDLVSLMKDEILKYDELIRKLNKKIQKYQKVYNVLKPNGVSLRRENVLKLMSNINLLDEIIEIIKDVNLVAMEKMIRSKIMFDEHDKEIKKSLSDVGLSKEIIFSDDFLNSLSRNPRLKKVHDKLIEMKKRDEELFRLNEQIVFYVFESMISLYEETKEEKERLKESKKNIEYALSKYRCKERLNPKDVSVIVTLIATISDYKKRSELSNAFNLYLKSFNKKSDEHVEEVKTNVKDDVRYVDSASINEKENSDEELDHDDKDESDLCNNYLMAISSFDNYDDVSMFLNSVKYDCDIKSVLHKMIEYLKETPENESLKQYLTKYLEGLNHDFKKEAEIHDNVVFYYDFLNKKNRILSDISKGEIPTEYYNDVLTGLKMIKENGAKNKRQRITRIRKVFKIRVHDIRITYKRLSNNIYVVLGVFCKKDHHGINVINTTLQRNNELIGCEKAIVMASKVDEVWNEYLSVNSDFENELTKLLSGYQK